MLQVRGKMHVFVFGLAGPLTNMQCCMIEVSFSVITLKYNIPWENSKLAKLELATL